MHVVDTSFVELLNLKIVVSVTLLFCFWVFCFWVGGLGNSYVCSIFLVRLVNTIGFPLVGGPAGSMEAGLASPAKPAWPVDMAATVAAREHQGDDVVVGLMLTLTLHAL